MVGSLLNVFNLCSTVDIKARQNSQQIRLRVVAKLGTSVIASSEDRFLTIELRSVCDDQSVLAEDASQWAGLTGIPSIIRERWLLDRSYYGLRWRRQFITRPTMESHSLNRRQLWLNDSATDTSCRLRRMKCRCRPPSCCHKCADRKPANSSVRLNRRFSSLGDAGHAFDFDAVRQVTDRILIDELILQ